MTREQLDAIRARVEAGTARGLSTQIEIDRDGTTRWVNLGPYLCATHEDAAQVRDIVTFIHAAPTDLRALLEELDRREIEYGTMNATMLEALCAEAEAKAEVERLTAERDTTFKRGVAAMREAAVTTLESAFAAGDNNLFPQGVAYGLRLVRALLDPEDKR